MGIRGELFTTQVTLDNRAYFFNVKQNRAGDVFLQIVESKNNNGEDFDRRAIVIFAEDMQKFFKGMDESIAFIEKDQKEKAKAKADKKPGADSKKFLYKKSSGKTSEGRKAGNFDKKTDGAKKAPRLRVKSKRTEE